MSNSPHETPPPLPAAPVTLEYAHAQPNRELIRNGKQVIGPREEVVLPHRCVLTGDTPEEAATNGTELKRIDRKLSWTPTWFRVIVIIGVLLFRPLLLVALFLYFIARKQVQVQFHVRRDLRRKRITAALVLLGLAFASVGVGIYVVAQTDEPLWFVAGLGGFLLFAIVAAYFSQSIRVAAVRPDRAVLTGFGSGFLERAEFGFDRGITSAKSGRGFEVIPAGESAAR